MEIGKINVKQFLQKNLKDYYTIEEEKNGILAIKRRRSNRKFEVPSFITMNTNFLVWCGLYEAEGGKRGTVTYHTDSPFEFNFFVANLNKILVAKSFSFGLNLCPRSVDKKKIGTLCNKYSDEQIKDDFPLNNLSIYEKAFFDRLIATPIKIEDVKISDKNIIALGIYKKDETFQYAYFNKSVEIIVTYNKKSIKFNISTDIHGFVYFELPDEFIENIEQCEIKVKGEQNVKLPNDELYESNFFTPHPLVDLKIKSDFSLFWGNQVHIKENKIQIPGETTIIKIKCLQSHHRPTLAYDKKQVKYTKYIKINEIDNDCYLDEDKKIKLTLKNNKLNIKDSLDRQNLHYIVTVFKKETNEGNMINIEGADSLSYEILIPEIDFKFTKSWRTYKGGTTFDYKPQDSSSMFDYVKLLTRSVFEHFYLSKPFKFIESKYKPHSILGKIDLLEVLKDHKRHNYEIVSSNEKEIEFKKKRGRNTTKITRFLSISPSLLVSTGMFMGDGSNMMRIENKLIGFDLIVFSGISIVNQDITTIGVGYNLADYLNFKKGVLGIEVLGSYFKTIKDYKKYSTKMEKEVKNKLKKHLPFIDLGRLTSFKPFVTICGTNAVISKSGSKYNVKLLFPLDLLQTDFILDKKVQIFNIRHMSLLGKLFYFSDETMNKYKQSKSINTYT
tara:strand:- start:1560 stop:3569 length:2010 start_codon:yes stop_codon:yes gene_type:complete